TGSLPLEGRTVSLTGGTECIYFLSYKTHRDLLIALKYGDESKTSRVTGPLSESLSALREEHTRGTAPLVIIPLPQSKLRVLRRGFNQTKRLLQDTLRSDKEKLFTLETNNLIKIRETKKQALLPKSERLIAQKNAFF